MNSNLFHNILNVVIIGLSMMTAGLLATGCTTLPTGAIECSKSFLDPAWTSFAIMVAGVVKVGVNLVRDGLKGLAAPQPPVVIAPKPTKPAGPVR